MAAKKKNTGSRSKATAGSGSRSSGNKSAAKSRSTKAGTGRTKAQTASGGSGVWRDIILLLILLCSVVLFVSVLGFGGRFGKSANYVLFGMFGLMAYIFPLALFGGCAFYIANKRNGMIIRKMIGFIMLFICMCMLFHLMTMSDYKSIGKITEYFTVCASDRTGGGIVAGLFAYAAKKAGFNTIITATLTLFMIFISLIILTQKPLFTLFGRKGRDRVRRVRDTQREHIKRRMRESEAHQMELDLRTGDTSNKNADEDDVDFFDDDDEPISAREAVRLHKKKAPVKAENEEYRGWDEDEDEAVKFVEPRKAPKSENKSEGRRRAGRKKNAKIESAAPVETGTEPVVSLKERITINGEQIGDTTDITPVPDNVAPEQGVKIRKADDSVMPSFLHGVLAGKDTRAVKTEAAQKKDKNTSLPSFDAEGDEVLASGVMEILASEEDDDDEFIEGSADSFNNSEIVTSGFDDEEEDEDDTRFIPLTDFKVGKDGKLSYEGREEPRVKSVSVRKKASQKIDQTAEPPYAEASEEAAPAESVPARSQRKNPKSAEAEIEEGVLSIDSEIRHAAPKPVRYKLPSVNLLTKGEVVRRDSKKQLLETANRLEEIFNSFGVAVHVINVSKGPTVTRYELQPEQGVKVSRIVALTDDIKLNLAASEIRIEAPIPGKAAVGIEVPNKEVSPVTFRDMIESQEYRKSKAPLTFAVGKDISGKAVVSDIAKMPHLLIAGATGSGKSVCINTLIMSVLYKSTPDEVKMLMIDPKVVEFKIYDGIPHLLIPVVTDPKKAAGALNWAVHEMNDRYNKFSEYPGVRDLKTYNQKIDRINEALPDDEKRARLPQILIIVDELADLMMVAPGEVEDAICRLAQLARAAGIHLVIATQRPSVNVVTGLIKANMPSRIALSVSSGVDSRTIIDMNGAEKLLGNGDMLYYPQGYPKPARLQGAYVSDDDITKVVKFLSSQSNQVVYNNEVEDKIIESMNNSVQNTAKPDDDRDPYFYEAGRFIIEKDKASIGMLQRMFKIGFNRAARIMDQLCEAGVVGPEEGTKPRRILMSKETFDDMFEAE